MNATQHELDLPAGPAPRCLTLDQVHNLYGAAEEALRGSHPTIASQLTRLTTALPASRRAALALLYAMADADAKKLIRTMRALAQLIVDNEAHAARQPTHAAVVTISPLAVATAAYDPSNLSES